MSLSDLFRPYPVRRSGIVNLKSNSAFTGVIWQVSQGWLVLKNAEMLQDQGRKVQIPMDGEVVLSVKDIDFIQVIP